MNRFDQQRLSRQLSWNYRFINEFEFRDSIGWYGYFVTFTFNDDYINIYSDYRVSVQPWIDALRKQIHKHIKYRAYAVNQEITLFDPTKPWDPWVLTPEQLTRLDITSKLKYKNLKSQVLSYVCVTEFGKQNNRKHYHLAIFVPYEIKIRDFPRFPFGFSNVKKMKDVAL